MPVERLLITVKTYPTLSKKYGELVCTAAVREDGSWVRLFPIPFRLLDYTKRYAKWSWIETALRKGTRDVRPETHHPVDPNAIRIAGKIGTASGWRDRRRLILERGRVYTSLRQIIDGAHKNQLSLAVFKPSEILDVRFELCDRDWNPEKVEHIRKMLDQGRLFEGDDWRTTLQLVRKLPYDTFYVYRDEDGKETKQLILDWEIGQLYWNCLKLSNGDEKGALDRVRNKLMTELTRTDLHLFLGTTEMFHLRAPNPWLIVGLFYPPHPEGAQQLELL
jgi:hypothetical protein